MSTNLNGVYTADAYFRLSREDGDKTESDSIVNQRALVKEFLKTHPDIQIYHERVDDGFSGVNFERPAFKEMLEDIKLGKVNCVIVKDLSRFGRDYIEAGRYIEKIFPYLGVRFIAINDNIDTASGINGAEEMLIPFKNLINDAYCRDISIKSAVIWILRGRMGSISVLLHRMAIRNPLMIRISLLLMKRQLQ